MSKETDSAENAYAIHVKYFKNRMHEMGINQKELAKMINKREATLSSNFSQKSMSHLTYLKICKALELNPFLIPAEMIIKN